MDRKSSWGPWMGWVVVGTTLVSCSDSGSDFEPSWMVGEPAAEAMSLPSGGFRVVGAKQDSVAEWHVGTSLADGIKVKSSHGPGMTVRRFEGAEGAGALEDGVVVYEGGEVDVRVFATEHGVEDLWRFHEPRTEWGYELELPQGYRLHEVEAVPGLVEVQDERGTSRMRVHARAAWDARGRKVPIEVEVTGNRLVVGVRDVEAWPVVVDPEWTDSGVMLYGRDGATLTPLATGKVLVAGGDAPMTGVAELYDPLTGTFTATGSMVVPRRNHFASLLGDGRVVIVGGTNAEFAGLEEVEVYDPLKGVFAVGGTVAEMKNRAISMLPSGRVLVVSGLEGEIFDPETGDTVAGYAPLGSPISPGVVLHDGTVLTTSDTHTQVFDEGSGSFSWGPDLLAKTSWPTTTELPDGRILVAGGVGEHDTDEHDTDTQVIDLDEGTKPGPELAIPRVGHSALLHSDGRILIAGGNDSQTTDIIDVVSLERHAGPTLRSPMGSNMAALLPDGRVLAAGTDQVVLSLDPRMWTQRLSSTQFAVQRVFHTATQLDSGDIVFIGDSSFDGTVEIFDPESRELRILGQLNEPSHAHTATLLEDGTILVVGGWPDNTAKHRWELFDPAAGESIASGLLKHGRKQHTATKLPGDRVLLAGGPESPILEVWDPVTHDTVEVGELSETFMWSAATLLPDNRVLVTGGERADGSYVRNTEWIDTLTWEVTAGPPLTARRVMHSVLFLEDHNSIVAMGTARSVEELDLLQNDWRMTSPTHENRWGGGAVRLPSGRVLFSGGLGYSPPTGDAYTYDPSDKAVRYTGCDVYEAPDDHCKALRTMTVPRANHTATLISDHEVLIAGGRGTPNGFPVGSRSLEIFDAETETFSRLALAFRPHGSATLLSSGKLLLTGGTLEGVTECDLWDPVNERAQKTADMAVPRSGHTTTMLDTGKVLLAGGAASVVNPPQGTLSTPSNSVEIFDPSNESFTAAPSMLLARSDHSATRLPSGEILMAGGTDAPTCEVFDPTAGTFRATGSLHDPRSRHAAVLTSRGQIVIAGGESPSGEPVRSIEIYDPQTNQFEILPTQAPAGGRTVGAAESSGRLVFMGNGIGYTLDPSLSASQGLAGAPRDPAAILTLPTGGLALCGDGGELFTCVHLLPGSNVTTPMFEKDATEGSAIARLASGELWVGTIEKVGDPMTDVFSQSESAASRPAVTQYPERIPIDEAAVVHGHGFASHPAFHSPAPMPGILPAIALLPANGGPPVPCTIDSWTDTSITFTPAQTAFLGPAWLHVVVHGVPSEGKLVLLQLLDGASACSIDAACATGYCVEGVCCDTSCTDPCLSCLAVHKGAGEDGVCGAVSEGIDPKEGCEEQPAETCGTTGVCDGNGACAWTPEGRSCAESRLCRGHECMPTMGEPCETSAECASDQVCGPNGTCERESHESEMVDPGGGCSCRTTRNPSQSPWPWAAALAMLVIAARRRAQKES